MRKFAATLLILLVGFSRAGGAVIEDFEGGDLGKWQQTCSHWQIVTPGCESPHAVASSGPITEQYRLDHLGFLGGVGRYSYDLMFPGAGTENGCLYFDMHGDCCFLQVIYGPVPGNDAQDKLVRVRANQGVATTLACAPASLPPNQWCHIEIERYANGVIRVYVNGALGMEGRDTELLSGGKIALYAHGGGVMFDNIAFDPNLWSDPPIPSQQVCNNFGVASCEQMICGGASSCPAPYSLDHTSDVNCDGVTDVLDVVLLINAAFRGAATSAIPPCGIAP